MKRETRQRIGRICPPAYNLLRNIVHRFRMSFEPAKISLEDGFGRAFGAPKATGLSFAQIGANVGTDQYDRLGKFSWQGVQVEPQPQVYAKLKANGSVRPEIGCENAAIGLKRGVLPFYICPLTEQWWATGMASLKPDTIKKQFNDGWIKQQCLKNDLPVPQTVEECIQKIDIQVITWEDLRDKYSLNNLDVLLVDVEGLDDTIVGAVLAAGDRPRLIAFEHQHLSIHRRWRIRQRLRKEGYECFSVQDYDDTIAILKTQ